MAAKTKKKRTMSPAQKKALEKGRRALALKRKNKTKPPLSKKTGSYKKRKSASSSNLNVFVAPNAKRTSTGGGIVNKKKNYGKRAGSFIRKAGAMEALKQASLAIAGGIASSMVINKIPIGDDRIKSMIPIAGGLLMAGTIGQENEILSGIANGMMVIGTISLFKKLAPNVPMLAGERVYYLPADTRGYIPDYSGMDGGLNLSGSILDTDYISPANI